MMSAGRHLVSEISIRRNVSGADSALTEVKNSPGQIGHSGRHLLNDSGPI